MDGYYSPFDLCENSASFLEFSVLKVCSRVRMMCIFERVCVCMWDRSVFAHT